MGHREMRSLWLGFLLSLVVACAAPPAEPIAELEGDCGTVFRVNDQEFLCGRSLIRDGAVAQVLTGTPFATEPDRLWMQNGGTLVIHERGANGEFLEVVSTEQGATTSHRAAAVVADGHAYTVDVRPDAPAYTTDVRRLTWDGATVRVDTVHDAWVGRDNPQKEAIAGGGRFFLLVGDSGKTAACAFGATGASEFAQLSSECPALPGRLMRTTTDTAFVLSLDGVVAFAPDGDVLAAKETLRWEHDPQATDLGDGFIHGAGANVLVPSLRDGELVLQSHIPPTGYTVVGVNDDLLWESNGRRTRIYELSE